MTYESKPPSIGLWKNDRGPYASGNCGGIRFVLWENTDKHSDNSPDFRLVLEAPQRREDSPPRSKPGSDVDNTPDESNEPPGDSIPF